MAVSKNQQGHVNKYIKNHYDRVNLTIPKGRKEDLIQAAEANGMSTNEYINTLLQTALNLSPEEWKAPPST